ncbi:hypothetical protein SESBI_17981 [Sesbania bispinosa]|nr:hypothetical protein SESBI_17981 [Sesbania bispinosa]
MEANKEEALKAIENAEKRFSQRDFAGAKNYAVKAKTLCPELEGLSQMVATFEVYIASEVTHNGELDYYSILGLKPSADKRLSRDSTRRWQFCFIQTRINVWELMGHLSFSEAWTWLSDSTMRSSYDLKRNGQSGGINHTNLSSVHATGATVYNKCSNLTTSRSGLDTFWTICTSCKVQYEYLRKYVNKRLSCKNCRGTFVAVETGAAPANGSFPYCPWSYVPGNGGALLELSIKMDQRPYQLILFIRPWNVNVKRGRPKLKSGPDGRHHVAETVANINSDVSFSCNEPQEVKASRPDKKRKVVAGANFRNGYEEKGSKCASEAMVSNGNDGVGHGQKLSCTNEVQTKQCFMPPPFDARKLLIEKARTEIRKKLEEMKETCRRAVLNVSGLQSENGKAGPVSITVPDPDFHDFDKDRAEECFKPKQIWALYDEEDGMPRLYCLIREVISVNPFKIHISYLNSKTDSEFGSVNWLDSGFTKSLGNFRAWNSDVVDQVNIFSHVLSQEKAGRGGCVRIYPRSGDIWAVYRNWSPDWNRSTPDKVRHQYEMVEVLDDYSEELGVCVTPLIKLAGFKTVYTRNTDKSAIKWIPRREMLRFSHQVPSWLLKEEANNLPERCWDLDPAATPDELLHAAAT